MPATAKKTKTPTIKLLPIRQNIKKFIRHFTRHEYSLMRKVAARPLGPLEKWLSGTDVDHACGCLIGTMGLRMIERDKDAERFDSDSDSSYLVLRAPVNGWQPNDTVEVAHYLGEKLADPKYSRQDVEEIGMVVSDWQSDVIAYNCIDLRNDAKTAHIKKACQMALRKFIQACVAEERERRKVAKARKAKTAK